MAIDPQTLRSERYVEIGTVLQRDAAVILERWCQRAVEEQPNARRVHHAALRDQLATLLCQIGRALAESVDDEQSPHCSVALEHGEQRWETGWSLPEVVRDYQILRLVVLEYLEDVLERPLTCRENMAFGLAIDEAITASVGMFVGNRDDHVRQLERERLEQERLSGEALHRWEEIFQQTGLGLVTIEPVQYILQMVNPAFAQMHGYTAQELIGSPLSQVLIPEVRADFPSGYLPVGPHRHHVYEAYHVRKDGSRFPVRSHVTAFRNEAGKILFWAATYEDVTERKQLEESLRRQAEALREADRRKDEFLAILAHELRNPLAPIVTSIEVLRLVGPDNTALTQARDVVNRQVRQMARIVDDLLDVTRISRGKIELRKERIDLAAVLNQAVQTSRPLVEARRHQLTVSLPPTPVRLEADQARLVQVVVNLLNNAARYTDHGGQIWLNAERQGNQAVIRVRDTGVGIAPALLPRIFEMYAQAADMPERTQGGLGIGLTLVRKLVELHGGTVEAHSAGPGRGSEFIVRLPALGHGDTASLAQPTAETRPVPRHVLIIEDNPDGRQSLGTLLQLLGHKVEVAEDGLRGVEKALAAPPEVALIDLGLPGLDGYQVAERLRTELGAGTFLIALTGFGQEEDRRRAIEVGFDAHLLKPVDVPELNRLLALAGTPRG